MSNETKHTPGPWAGVPGFGPEYLIYAEGDTDDFVLAIVKTREPGTKAQKQEALANTRLAIAAPELLEACQRLVSVIDVLGGNCPAMFTHTSAEEFARAAMAKATGQDSAP